MADIYLLSERLVLVPAVPNPSKELTISALVGAMGIGATVSLLFHYRSADVAKWCSFTHIKSTVTPTRREYEAPFRHFTIGFRCAQHAE